MEAIKESKFKRSLRLFLKAYRKKFLLYEIIIGFLIALFSILIAIKIVGSNQIVDSVKAYSGVLYPLVAQISGTLLGFVITAVSIIISLIDRSIFKDFRKSKSYPELYQVYFSTIKWLGLTTAFSVLSIFISSNVELYFFFVFLFLSVVSVLRLYRTVWVLVNIVEIIRRKDKS